MRPEVREIGSEFHWDPAVLLAVEQDGRLPAGHRLFATGCGAMSALLRRLAVPGRLHIPTFFCMGVAEALGQDTPLAWYRHLPDGRGPRWETLRAAPGDVVLAQNLFGREDGAGWRDWIAAHPDVTVIEDHSHDPFGPWARTSTAPYAVASLRKTLPVPDGGLLWSPQGLDLPEPTGAPDPAVHLKLTAMLLKAAWLDGRPVAKDTFRALQQRGEQELLGSDAPAGPFTAAVLPVLDIAGLRTVSTRNALALEALITRVDGAQPALSLSDRAPAGRCGTGVRPAMESPGTPGAAPFRVQLVCASREARDTLLTRLAREGIFAPVHWRQDRDGTWSGDEQAADLADRILTLPVDHRCGPAEVHRVAEAVAAFSADHG